MRILLIVAIFFAGSAAASACGNPMLWAMLFAKVPEAKLVYESELSARAEGEVEARIYDAKPGQAYHAWSKAWLLRLAEDMQPSTGAPASLAVLSRHRVAGRIRAAR